MTGGSELLTSSGLAPTPSGTFPPPYGGFPHPAEWYPFPLFLPMIHPPLPWINPTLQQPATTSPLRPRIEEPTMHQDSNSTDNEEVLLEPEEEQDVDLLEEGKADQFRDPKKWQPPPSVVNYLNKYFNKSLADAVRQFWRNTVRH